MKIPREFYFSSRLSTCKKFSSSIVLPATIEFIFVKCESMGKTVYKNTHAVIRERSNIRQRLTEFKEKTKNNRPLSVLMLSIDSVSRLNLIRAMPKTAQHLYDSGWFELQGYNKVISEFTFPYNFYLLKIEWNKKFVWKMLLSEIHFESFISVERLKKFKDCRENKICWYFDWNIFKLKTDWWQYLPKFDGHSYRI